MDEDSRRDGRERIGVVVGLMTPQGVEGVHAARERTRHCGARSDRLRWRHRRRRSPRRAGIAMGTRHGRRAGTRPRPSNSRGETCPRTPSMSSPCCIAGNSRAVTNASERSLTQLIRSAGSSEKELGWDVVRRCFGIRQEPTAAPGPPITVRSGSKMITEWRQHRQITLARQYGSASGSRRLARWQAPSHSCRTSGGVGDPPAYWLTLRYR